MSILLRTGFAGNGPADSPQLGGRQSDSFVFELKQRRSRIWALFQVELWIVRPKEADSPLDRTSGLHCSWFECPNVFTGGRSTQEVQTVCHLTRTG